jgi:hypothetical protein
MEVVQPNCGDWQDVLDRPALLAAPRRTGVRLDCTLPAPAGGEPPRYSLNE